MKLPQIKNWKVNNLAWAFMVPSGAMLLMMLIRQFEPFGNDYAILYSDMYHQYYPFFVAFRKALLSGESLLWTWDVGLGIDYLGLIAYYLASPLNLLCVLMPESILLECYELLLVVRLGLAGLFFAIFLKELFGKDDFSIAIFGGFYALCSWSLGYLWNVMWLDTFALLPLVALGTVKLLRDRKFILYTSMLFLAIFANYYVSYFVCIFVFFIFCFYELCRWKGLAGFAEDLFRIAFFTLIAIGMTAILELPTYVALGTTQSGVNAFPKGFKLNIATENTWKGLLDALRQVAGNMAGFVVPTFKEGLPNVYTGVCTMVMAFMFLLNRKVKLSDKICSVVLLIFFMFSFVIRQLDYMWHGFHFTNMIPYRFSFLFSFVMLYMAYRAWMNRGSMRLWQIPAALILSGGVVACNNLVKNLSLLKGSNAGDSWQYLVFNVTALLAVGATLWYGIRKKKIPEDAHESVVSWIKSENAARRVLSSRILLAIMAVELGLSMVNFGVNFAGTSVAYYPRGGEYAASMIRYMHEREEDTLFYRAEATHSQTLNDGALNGYNGVSTFTSSANVKVTEFMRMLGYAAKNTYNRYCYEEASPVSDLFLNLKYMIERSGRDRESTYFDELHRYGDVALLKNNHYLPLGFLAEEELADMPFAGNYNGFRFQNVLMNAATGLEGDVWHLLGVDDLVISGQDVTLQDQHTAGYCTYSGAANGATILYTYTVPRDGFMCVELDFPKRNNVSIWKNGDLVYSETMTLRQMMAVADVVAGDVVEIKATCTSSNESGSLEINAAILDQARFDACYGVLSASTLELTEFTNTYVAGQITCDRDGLLYTSVPQNGNWHVYVDGKEAEVVLIGDVMVGVKLTEGDHLVELKYKNRAFAWGWKISLLSAGIFAAVIYQDRKKKPQGGKYRKA